MDSWNLDAQAVVATIPTDGDSHANEVAGQLTSHRLWIETDLRNEKIGYEVRSADKEQVAEAAAG